MLITDGIKRLVGSRESVIAIYMGYVSSSAANDETQSKSHHIEARRAYDSLFFFSLLFQTRCVLLPLDALIYVCSVITNCSFQYIIAAQDRQANNELVSRV